MTTEHKPHIDPPEPPLHDFIDMEAYDVVAGEHYRSERAGWIANLDAEIAERKRLEEQLEAVQSALREIASYTSSRNIDDDFGKFANDRIQEMALLALAASSPASVRVWNRALSPEEIEADYNQERERES